MMPVLTAVLYTSVVIVALLIIALVLIQQSKGGGFGSAFGGAGESMFGAHVGSHLTKFTVILTTVFFILTLLLAAITGLGNREEDASLGKEIEGKPNQTTANSAVKALPETFKNKVKPVTLPKTTGGRP